VDLNVFPYRQLDGSVIIYTDGEKPGPKHRSQARIITETLGLIREQEAGYSGDDLPQLEEYEQAVSTSRSPDPDEFASVITYCFAKHGGVATTFTRLLHR